VGQRQYPDAFEFSRLLGELGACLRPRLPVLDGSEGNAHVVGGAIYKTRGQGRLEASTWSRWFDRMEVPTRRSEARLWIGPLPGAIGRVRNLALLLAVAGSCGTLGQTLRTEGALTSVSVYSILARASCDGGFAHLAWPLSEVRPACRI
jgi:hypothetical protein